MSDVYNELSGANRQARAAEGAARAQMAASREQQDLAVRLSEASPQELRAYETTLTSAEKRLANAERMFSAIDPAILEASNQILRILQGEQTSAGGVFEGERSKQRQALLDQLRAQYGPGAEFTSLGKRALQEFDSQTAVGGVGVQQNALSTLGGIFGMGQSANQELGAGSAAVGASGGLFGNVATRQANAAMGTGSNIVNTAGGEFMGDMIRGQGQGQLFNLAVRGGAAYLSGGVSEAAGGSGNGGGGSNNGFARLFAG